MFWWYTHLGNFIGGYIAAWTAFRVVTLPALFENHLGVAHYQLLTWHGKVI